MLNQTQYLKEFKQALKQYAIWLFIVMEILMT